MLSKEGDGLGIAQRLQTEGNDVRLYIESPKFPLAGVGLLKRVGSWRPHIAWSDFVVCDMVGFGKYEDTFRKLGKPVISCNRFADMLELDRRKGMELFEKVGMQIPETHALKGPTDVLVDALISTWESPGFVIKPSGNEATAKTYVCRDPETFEWALSTIPADTPLIVQKLITGVEVSTEGWFNGRDWIRPFNHTFEEKRFLEGNLGPNTGCMGNVVVACGEDKLVKETVMKLTPFLSKVGYRGPVDINSIVNEGGAYVLEATMRFGYDAIEALMEGLMEPVVDLLFETALGAKKEMKLSSDRLIAVRVSVPPWPHAPTKATQAGRPLIGVNEDSLRHLYLTDIYKQGDDYLFAAGDGVVYKATARGRSLQEARTRVYRTVQNVKILDMQYREDIGSRFVADWEKLKELGYVHD